MPTPPIEDGTLIERYRAWKELGTVKASHSLGVSESIIRRSVDLCRKRGLVGDVPGSEGYEIKAHSAQFDEDGNVKSRSVKYTQPLGEEWATPDGHTVKGISALIDADGRTVQQWVKTSKEKSPQDIAKAFEDAFANFKPCAPYIIPRKDRDDERLTVYIWADWHIGLFAWGAETGGPDWDLKIAREAINNTITEVVEAAPPSKNAIILGLGDLLHQDGILPITSKSGNILDSDTRYAKCLETLCDLAAENTEKIAQKHHNVDIVVKPGNHDEASTVGLRMALRAYWRNDDRIKVDTSPDPFYWHKFGTNLIGGVHGDKAKPAQLPLIMANRMAQAWAGSTTRHIHTGHLHHKTEIEDGGVSVFQHRAPVAQDAYHAHHGFLSGRSMRAYIYHKTKGARGNIEIEMI